MRSNAEFSAFGVEIADPVWRVARRQFDPMTVPPSMYQGTGRFDDPSDSIVDGSDNFGILYCGMDSYGAFLETLHPYRRRLDEVEKVVNSTVMEVEVRDAFVEVQLNQGRIERDWSPMRELVTGRLSYMAPVFDLTNPSALQALRAFMAPSLLALGLDDLDFSHVLSDNRELTRAISRWIWTMTNDSGEPLFSGIRYRSRFDPECICLALYDGRFSIDGDIDNQSITPETPGFAEAAKVLRLQIA